MLHWPILLGQTVVVLPKFEIGAFCELVERYKVTINMLVPPIALLLARDPIVDKYDMSSLRLVISGAAPLGPELEKELARRLNTNVTQVGSVSRSFVLGLASRFSLLRSRPRFSLPRTSAADAYHLQ